MVGQSPTLNHPQKPEEPKNFRLNQIRNARLIGRAVSDQTGSAEFHIFPDTNSGASGLFRTATYKVPTETVKSVTLSALLDEEKLPQIDLMKMDIEGYEYEAILGSPEGFRSHRIRTIALELHTALLSRRGLNERQITAFLEDCGYRLDRRFETTVYSCCRSSVDETS